MKQIKLTGRGGAGRGQGRKESEPTKVITFRVKLDHEQPIRDAVKKTIDKLNKKTIMKTITILCMAITLFSCSKEKASVCWKCTYGTINGIAYPDYNECNAGEEPKPPTVDAAGNDLSYYCKRK